MSKEETPKEIANHLATGWWWGSLLSLSHEDFIAVQTEYKNITGKNINKVGYSYEMD